jgi:hypothetical protein
MQKVGFAFVSLSCLTKLFHEILPNLVEKMKQIYVWLKLIDFIPTTTSFDLWMSKGAHDVFTFVINFLGSD